jgi:hypothetical protein
MSSRSEMTPPPALAEGEPLGPMIAGRPPWRRRSPACWQTSREPGSLITLDRADGHVELLQGRPPPAGRAYPTRSSSSSRSTRLTCPAGKALRPRTEFEPRQMPSASRQLTLIGHRAHPRRQINRSVRQSRMGPAARHQIDVAGPLHPAGRHLDPRRLDRQRGLPHSPDTGQRHHRIPGQPGPDLAKVRCPPDKRQPPRRQPRPNPVGITMTGQVAGKLPHQPTVPPRPGDNQGGQKHPGSSMLPRPSLADPQKPRSCRTGRRPDVEPMQSQTQITPFGATEDGNHVCQIADQINKADRACRPAWRITKSRYIRAARAEDRARGPGRSGLCRGVPGRGTTSRRPGAELGRHVMYTDR